LGALISRGFRLSVSIEGLREVWAKSISQSKFELLTRRIELLAPLLDKDSPVAFVGTALLGLVVSLPTSVAADAAQFRERVNRGFSNLPRNRLTQEEWLNIGQELQSELSGEERWWNQQIETAIVLDKEVQTLQEKIGIPFYPRSRGFKIIKRGMAPPFRARTEPSFEARFDAFHSYLAMKLTDARNHRPQQNDYLDARHLCHLGWPAFLVTMDLKLIHAVDASGTRQRAWVRTPAELVLGSVTRCPPWGAAADKIARQFTRLPRAQLGEQLEHWREALGQPG
jgi:hypothetical protein